MYSANRVDLATSFFQPMMDFVPKARRAAGYKNCSALSYAAHIGPFGFASADSGMSQGAEHGDLGFQDNGLFAGATPCLNCFRAARWNCDDLRLYVQPQV